MKNTYIAPISEIVTLTSTDVLLASFNFVDEFGAEQDNNGMDWNNPA